jgi:glycosyltransferase involved in cell wall biosynthesis
LYPGSITQKANQTKPYIKKLQYTRRAFLRQQVLSLQFNKFDRRVLAATLQPPLSKTISRLKRFLATPFIIGERLSFSWEIPKSPKKDKPRILFLVPWLSMGGAEKVILDLAQGLSDEFEAHIIITEQVMDNNWAYRFNTAREIIDLRKVVHYPSNKTAYVVRYVAANHIDFVIISNSFVGYSAIPAIKRTSINTKIIDILHGQGGRIDKGSSPLFSLPYHKLIDKRITVTNYLRSYMNREYGLHKNDFHHIPNGVSVEKNIDNEKGNYKKNNSIDINTRVVAWVGRFNDEKKPFLGLEVARQVLQEANNCVFIFAGDGPQKKQMEEFIKRSGLQKRILLPGPLDNPEQLLIDSEVLLLTSEMEGMPLAILEASAIGVPVVATRVGGVPEIVSDSKTGFLISYDENSVKNFSAAVLKLLNDNELQGLFSVNSIQKAESFTKQKMIDEYRKILESL